MSTKIYCDCCDRPASVDYADKGFRGQAVLDGKLKVYISIDVAFARDDIHLCSHCFSQALVQVAPVNILLRRETEDEEPGESSTRRRSRARATAE